MRKRRIKQELIRVDNDLRNTYGQWKPIKDISRSFFVWKGKFSGSFKEKEIAGILKEQNLRFYSEVSFDLKTRFDFYIPLIDLVIEYDGGQHFHDFKVMGRDIKKEQLLKQLGVKFIRYNKTHDLSTQIPHDLIYHPVLQ
jgi:hypothetical protein